jgi:hypothetical protein
VTRTVANSASKSLRPGILIFAPSGFPPFSTPVAATPFSAHYHTPAADSSLPTNAFTSPDIDHSSPSVSPFVSPIIGRPFLTHCFPRYRPRATVSRQARLHHRAPVEIASWPV